MEPVELEWWDGHGMLEGHDSDRITIIDLAPNPAKDAIRFTLHTQPPNMWWKGITAVDRHTGEILDGIQSEHGAMSHWTAVNIDIVGDIVDTRSVLVFWKAKWLGEHTPMYIVDPIALLDVRGNSFCFDWLTD